MTNDMAGIYDVYRDGKRIHTGIREFSDPVENDMLVTGDTRWQIYCHGAWEKKTAVVELWNGNNWKGFWPQLLPSLPGDRAMVHDYTFDRCFHYKRVVGGNWESERESELPITDASDVPYYKRKKDYCCWKPKDNVNAPHYKKYLGEMEWIDAMSRMTRFTPEIFEGALELQVRKYLDRLGKKDEGVQELTKSWWYLTQLIYYKTNGVANANAVNGLLSIFRETLKGDH